MAKPKPGSNTEIRAWYLEEISRIPQLNNDWTEQGISLKARAKRAWKFRHDKRLQAREMMQNEEEVEMLRNLDVSRYGNPDGPTFRFLVERLADAGLTENEVYEAIIEGSVRTNPEINKILGF